jgi:hypothetical protein
MTTVEVIVAGTPVEGECLGRFEVGVGVFKSGISTAAQESQSLEVTVD